MTKILGLFRLSTLLRMVRTTLVAVSDDYLENPDLTSNLKLVDFRGFLSPKWFLIQRGNGWLSLGFQDSPLKLLAKVVLTILNGKLGEAFSPDNFVLKYRLYT